MKPEAVYYS